MILKVIKDKELVRHLCLSRFYHSLDVETGEPKSAITPPMLPSAAHLRAEPRAAAWVGWGAVASAAAAKTWQKVNWSIIEILYLVNV